MELPGLPSEAEVLIERRTRRYYRDDAVRWVWILYGLAQAVVTMLMAFSVIEGTTVAAVVTAVALIIYVGVNELLVRPYRQGTSRRARRRSGEEEPTWSVSPVPPYDEEEPSSPST